MRLLPYLGVFLATAVAAYAATPLVRRFAVKVHAIDHPSDRKVHPRPTPTLGGLAMLVAVAVGVGVAFLIPTFRSLFRVSSEPVGALLAGIVILAIGAYDDLKGMAVPAKVAGQVLAAGVLIFNGIQLVYFWFPGLGVLSLSPDMSVLFTVLWVLVMVNAVNLIDGLDGLAAGVVAIAAAAFFAYTYLASEPIFPGPSPASLLSAIACGAAVGFLPHNYNPARIFMGDSGSMLLGILLAAATVSGVGRTDAPTNTDLAAFAIPIVIPLLVLAVPLTDVVLAIIRRIRRGRRVTRPDKEHIHHRLLEIGHTHRQAVLLMYMWSVLLATFALSITFVRSRILAIAVIVGVVFLLLGTALPRVWRANGRVRT